MATTPTSDRYWWEADGTECYWCEITDREDLGADLKCPQANENGAPHWSYSTIQLVRAGDIVFHYSAREGAFVAASVASGPLEERDILWVPHGTSGRAKGEKRAPRPGWWRPLYGFRRAAAPLALEALQTPTERDWVISWTATMKERHGTTGAPLYGYGGGISLRAAQAYLTKMPAAFVTRWGSLGSMAERLEDEQTELAEVDAVLPSSDPERATFRLKSDMDYVAFVAGGTQRRTRQHERLVRDLSEWLRARGAVLTTPHPIDLMMTSPSEVLFEIKIVGRRPCLLAVREAVGQVLEYRHFLYPQTPCVCLVVDREPEQKLVEYVETALGLGLAWFDGELRASPETCRRMEIGTATLPPPQGF